MFQASEIQSIVSACAGKIIITTHHKPDGDALGSSLGLYHFLKSMGKDATIISPTDFPNFLDWMPGRLDILIFESDRARTTELLKEAKIIFCLDFNSLSRINDMGEIVEGSSAIKIMIDHHQEPENFANYQYHTIDTSSTCELVYDFIYQNKLTKHINKSAATCLYVGIMTDTGGFKHNSTSSHTHMVASALMELGADHRQINQMVSDQNSLMRLKLIGYAVSRKLVLYENCKVALLTLDRVELAKHQVQTGDTEGLVNYGLSIAGVELSVLIVDRTEKVKMSFRSKNKFPCNIFAKENFEGGGHFHASGGQSTDTLENTTTKFLEKVKLYKEWL